MGQNSNQTPKKLKKYSRVAGKYLWLHTRVQYTIKTAKIKRLHGVHLISDIMKQKLNKAIQS